MPKAPIVSFILDAVFRPSRDNGLKSQFVRQFLSSFLATLVDILVFKLCLDRGMHPALSGVVSFFAALFTNFVITRYYVFGEVSRQKRRTFPQLVVYSATAVVSLGIFQAFLLAFHYGLGVAPFWVKIMSIPAVFVWTVLSGRFIVFNKE